MADIKTTISGLFSKLWVDLGGTTGYAEAVSLETQIAGEEIANDRLRTEVKPVDSDSVQELLQDSVTAAGTGTAINVKGYKSVTFRVNATSGTWNGGFQAMMDDTNWYYIQVTPVDTGTAINGSATQFNPAAATVDNLYTLASLPVGLSQIRFNLAARTSGTLIVASRKQPR